MRTNSPTFSPTTVNEGVAKLYPCQTLTFPLYGTLFELTTFVVDFYIFRLMDQLGHYLENIFKVCMYIRCLSLQLLYLDYNASVGTFGKYF